MIYNTLLLAALAHVAVSTPTPARGTESGGGVGPLANAPVPHHLMTLAHSAPKGPVANIGSALPIGSIITKCTTPNTVALTFDDGPHIYTSGVIDKLDAAGIKATFFVNGQNWGSISDPVNQDNIRRMVAEGHQVGSHTWSHADLATLDHAGIVSQMQLLEAALTNILGNYPTYMRPPYFSTNDLVLQTMSELGYHVIQADIDTLDWANDSEGAIQTSVQRYVDGLNAGGTIELSHDVHQWTANVLVPAMIDEVRKRGLQAVTVGECLGETDKSLWYRTA